MCPLRASMLSVALLPALAQGAPVEIVPERDSATVTALIPDLDRLLTHLEAAGGVLSPGVVAPGMLKAMLASQLGDPGLTNLGPGPLMGVLVKDPGDWKLVLFIPVRDGAPYTEALSKWGWRTRGETGLLAAAPTQEALDAGWGRKDSYRALAEEPPVGHDMRIGLQPDRVAAALGPIAEMGLKSKMPSSAPGVDGARYAQGRRFLALEMKALLAALSSSESLTSDLDLDASALSVRTVLRPKRGTVLATLSAMPASKSNPASGFVFGQGLMNSEWRFHPKTLSDFFTQLLDEVAKDPEYGRAPADMKAIVADMGRCTSGQLASSLRSGSAGWDAETAMTVADEGACLSMIEKAIHFATDPGSTFYEMYQDMGVSMSLHKAVRAHAGVTVHRLQIAMKERTPAKPSAEGKGVIPTPPNVSAPMVAAFMRDTEFAFAHGYYVASQDPSRVDALIDLARSGPPSAVRSESELLPDPNMVVSYDFVGLMKAIRASLPAQGADIFANLPPSEPVRFAMVMNQGVLESRWRMPLAPIAVIVQSAKRAAASRLPSPKPVPNKP